jgi:hypothetical protein
MWEITLFDRGTEVGTFDYSVVPKVGRILTDDSGSVKILDIIWWDPETRQAEVEIEYVD